MMNRPYSKMPNSSSSTVEMTSAASTRVMPCRRAFRLTGVRMGRTPARGFRSGSLDGRREGHGQFLILHGVPVRLGDQVGRRADRRVGAHVESVQDDPPDVAERQADVDPEVVEVLEV